MALTRERLEHLIARSPDIVVGTDRRGTVIYYNDGAKETLGYAPEEVLGAHVGIFYPDLAEAKGVMSAMRNGHDGVVDTFRTCFVSKSGERIPVAISGSILYETMPNGERIEDGTIGFAKDLREILHRDQLATLGEVAIGISHEINNPLAVILNQAELLEHDVARLAGEGESAVEVERVDAIRREIARISEILERLTEMAQGDKYETIGYIGPARMVDLRKKHARAADDDRLRGARVLVVDDDGGIRRSLTEILELDGCRVDSAGDGEEALAKLTEGRYDAVISDVVMPKMDGYDLYTSIHERWPGLPVLMMTAFHYDKDHIIKRSRMEGLSGVIFKKPVDPARLRETLIETIEKRRARQR
jgi:two-component system, cell cycle response regulator CpdR